MPERSGRSTRRGRTAPAQASRPARKKLTEKPQWTPEGKMLAWAEVGVTIATTEDPPQFVRFATGMEVSCNAQDYEAATHWCRERAEEVINRDAEHFARLVQDIGT